MESGKLEINDTQPIEQRTARLARAVRELVTASEELRGEGGMAFNAAILSEFGEDAFPAVSIMICAAQSMLALKSKISPDEWWEFVRRQMKDMIKELDLTIDNRRLN